MLIIETSSFQKFRQCYGPDKTQKCPRKSNIEIKILPGNQTENSTEANYDRTKNINSHSSVRRAGPAATAVQAQETRYGQADIK